jgi:hypothetical protein
MARMFGLFETRVLILRDIEASRRVSFFPNIPERASPHFQTRWICADFIALVAFLQILQFGTW